MNSIVYSHSPKLCPGRIESPWHPTRHIGPAPIVYLEYTCSILPVFLAGEKGIKRIYLFSLPSGNYSPSNSDNEYSWNTLPHD